MPRLQAVKNPTTGMARTSNESNSNTSETPPGLSLLSTRAAAAAALRSSPSPASLSTLSVSPQGSEATGRSGSSTARPSIFEATNHSLGEQPEVYEESDEEEAEGYPDDNSAASDADEFEMLADSTDAVLGCRFLFAKETGGDKEEAADMQHRASLEAKHRIVLQQGLDNNVSIREVPKDWNPPGY